MRKDTRYTQICLIRNCFWCESDSLLSDEISGLGCSGGLMEVRPGSTSKLELTHQVNQKQAYNETSPLLHSGPIRGILWKTEWHQRVKWNYYHEEIKAWRNFSMFVAWLSNDWVTISTLSLLGVISSAIPSYATASNFFNFFFNSAASPWEYYTLSALLTHHWRHAWRHHWRQSGKDAGISIAIVIWFCFPLKFSVPQFLKSFGARA